MILLENPKVFATISGILMIMYTFPFIVISLLYIYFGYRKKYKPLLTANVIALLVGLLSFKIMSQSEYIYFSKPHKLLNLSNSFESFAILMDQIGAYLLGYNFKSVIILLSLISLIFVSKIAFEDFFRSNEKRDNPATIYSLFSVMFSVSVFLAPVINGNYTGWDTIRYNISFFFLSILNLSFIFYMFSKKRDYRFIFYKRLSKITIGLAVVALAASVAMYSQDGIKKYFNYYPADVKKLMMLLINMGLNQE